MHRHTAVLFAGFMLCTAPLAAQPFGSVRQTIQAEYNAMNAALPRKSLKGFFAYRLPNFQSADARGIVDIGNNAEGGIARMFADYDNIHVHTNIVSISPMGPNTLNVIIRETRTMTHYSPQTLKANHIVEHDLTKDIWVRTRQGWREKSAQVIDFSQTENGHPTSP